MYYVRSEGSDGWSEGRRHVVGGGREAVEYVGEEVGGGGCYLGLGGV